MGSIRSVYGASPPTGPSGLFTPEAWAGAREAWPAALDASVVAAQGWHDAEDVRAACRSNRVRDLLDGDERAQRALARALEAVPSRAPRRALASARRLASRVLERLEREPHAVRLAVTGGLRRMEPAVDAIELLATSEKPEALMDALATATFVARAERQGDTLACALVDGASVVLRVLRDDAHAFVLAHVETTGPAAFVHALRARAQALGLVWDQWLTAGGRALDLETERDVFAALDLPYVAPERRHAEAPGSPSPALVEAADLRGLAALHGARGAGRFPLATLADAARSMAFAWVLVAERTYGPGPRLDLSGLTDLRGEAAAWKRLAEAARSDTDADAALPAAVTTDVLVGVRVAAEPSHDVHWAADADLVLGVPQGAAWATQAREALAAGDIDILCAPSRDAIGAGDLATWRMLVEAADRAGAALALSGDPLSAPPPRGLGALLAAAEVPVLLDAAESIPGDLDQFLAALGQARREAVPPPLVMNAWRAERLHAWRVARRGRAP